jgi:hypothetical protein
MVDTGTRIIQMWAAYGLRRVPVSLMVPMGYFESWTTRAAAEFTHNYSDRYVLREAGRYSDITGAPEKVPPIWRSSRFELYPFQDYLAIGANWYELERDSTSGWRWLNTDGEVLLIHPTESRYRFSFLSSPGPGGQGNVRHMAVLVNGEKVHEQVVTGASAEVATPLVRMSQRVNRIVIRVGEKAALIPNDPRLLNVAVRKVRVQGEQEVRRVQEELEPGSITSATLARFVSNMRGVYTDTWVGPDAEVSLWNRGADCQLQVEGQIPPWTGFRFPVNIAVKVNGVRAGTIIATEAGKFTRSVLVPPAVRAIEALKISLHTDRSFTGQGRGLNSDTRNLSFLFSGIRLASPSISACESKR